MQLNIEALMGEKFTITDVKPTDTIENIKIKLCNKYQQLPPYSKNLFLKLIYAG